jgi:hypothetical protein
MDLAKPKLWMILTQLFLLRLLNIARDSRMYVQMRSSQMNTRHPNSEGPQCQHLGAGVAAVIHKMLVQSAGLQVL